MYKCLRAFDVSMENTILQHGSLDVLSPSWTLRQARSAKTMARRPPAAASFIAAAFSSLTQRRNGAMLMPRGTNHLRARTAALDVDRELSEMQRCTVRDPLLF